MTKLLKQTLITFPGVRSSSGRGGGGGRSSCFDGYLLVMHHFGLPLGVGFLCDTALTLKGAQGIVNFESDGCCTFSGVRPSSGRRGNSCFDNSIF